MTGKFWEKIGKILGKNWLENLVKKTEWKIMRKKLAEKSWTLSQLKICRPLPLTQKWPS